MVIFSKRKGVATNMNTFWLKVAGVLIIVVIGIVLVGKFIGKRQSEAEQSSREKTFYDVAEHDKERFLTELQPAQPPQQSQAEMPQAPQETEKAEQPVSKPALSAAEEPQQKPQPSKPVTLYFSELSEIDNIEAERFLNVAVPGRSIGRLPMTGFKLMVDNCRRIIQRWPDSWYAYRAKQMLIDMPPRYQKRYKVTEKELDLSRFTRPRPGTKPMVVKESD
jgi:hypothetical protein